MESPWGCPFVGCPPSLAPQISRSILPGAVGRWFLGLIIVPQPFLLQPWAGKGVLAETQQVPRLLTPWDLGVPPSQTQGEGGISDPASPYPWLGVF